MTSFDLRIGTFAGCDVAPRRRPTLLLTVVGLGGLLVACSAGGSERSSLVPGSTAATTGGAGSTAPTLPTASPTVIVTPSGGGAGATTPNADVITSLPEGFVPADIGGYHLGAPLAAGETPATTGVCANVIRGVVRDFQVAHPDFETFCCGVLPGIVATSLGTNQKPVYAAGSSNSWETSTADNFNQWYTYVEGTNLPYLVELYLAPQSDGTFAFASSEFFPLDGAGWGEEGLGRNFHFTTEIHTRFHYAGGEVFSFEGDDDLWVFMNGQLVIDLGGVHEATLASVALDDVAATLGMTVDNTYDLDLFHAERHTGQSNFRLESTLDLVDCGIFVPDVIR